MTSRFMKTETETPPTEGLTVIELVSVKHPTIEWGLMFYPAHPDDQAKFLHCTDVGCDYLFNGGVMAQSYVDLACEVFKFHGLNPVIVDESKATWAFPRLKREAKTQNGNDPSAGSSPN